MPFLKSAFTLSVSTLVGSSNVRWAGRRNVPSYELFLVDGFVDRALASQRDSIVIDAKLDVVLIHFRELGLENEALFGFVEFHGGGLCPCGQELPLGARARQRLID